MKRLVVFNEQQYAVVSYWQQAAITGDEVDALVKDRNDDPIIPARNYCTGIQLIGFKTESQLIPFPINAVRELAKAMQEIEDEEGLLISPSEYYGY